MALIRIEVADEANKVLQVTAQLVQPPHDQCVAFAQSLQAMLEFRPVCRFTAPLSS